MEWFNLKDNVNLISIIGALVIIALTLVVAGKYLRDMKSQKDEAELSELEWDGIGEYKNELPVGWAIMFIVTLVWAVWYFLVGYPLNSYSQIGEYNDEVRSFNENFKAKHLNLDEKKLADMGSGIFLVQCAACHGITGDGIGGKAADLRIWGSEDGIVDAVIKGSKGLDYPLGEMPAGLLDEESAKAVAAYVVKEIMGAKVKNEALAASGKELFGICAACHGENGKSENGTMAPDLSKYGSAEFFAEILNRGKDGDIGVMPKFDATRLNELQQRALAHYLATLREVQ